MVGQTKDHFSGHADACARYRPEYPPVLFDYLAGVAPARDCAWDCGTGNGQAARALARRFRRVIATDLSRQQIQHARGPANVAFRVAQVLGYLRTWSATQRYIKARGTDPTLALEPQLRRLWPGAGAQTVSWPLRLRVCRAPVDSKRDGA